MGKVVVDSFFPAASPSLLSAIKLLLGVIICYATVSVIIQTKDDIRFVIPYVEFSKQIKGSQPVLLDTSAIIDGRDPLVTGDDGRVAVEIFTAIYRSQRDKKPICFPLAAESDNDTFDGRLQRK